MNDDRDDSGPRDRTTINMNENFELRYWSKELGVSLAQLRAIIRKVGPVVKDIREELEKSGNKGWRS